MITTLEARTVYVAIVLIVVLMLVGALTAIAGGSLFSPPDWLVSWTDWLLSALACIFAPLVLVSGAAALRKIATA